MLEKDTPENTSRHFFLKKRAAIALQRLNERYGPEQELFKKSPEEIKKMAQEKVAKARERRGDPFITLDPSSTKKKNG